MPGLIEHASVYGYREPNDIVGQYSSADETEGTSRKSDMGASTAYISEAGKEDRDMHTVPAIKLTRRQIYDDVWEHSVAGMAKKYSVPYAQLMKQIKDAKIPIPPSGYWTKLSFGKPVMKIELTEPFDEVITISSITIPIRKEIPRQVNSEAAPKTNSEKTQQNAMTERTFLTSSFSSIETSDRLEPETVVIPTQGPKTTERYGQIFNVYDRETLYKEVWEAPVVEVAKRYKVSDVAIHKVCKALDIPKPPPGYWAKLSAGKPVTIIPLPKSNKPSLKTGIQTGMTYQPAIEKETLAHLADEDCSIILSVAAQIILPSDNERMHPKITAHRKKVLEWKKGRTNKNSKASNRLNASDVPFLADGISDDMIPRACRIIDALAKAMEPLGCSVEDNLDLIVNNEKIHLSFSESQDQVLHTLTKEENMQLIKYEEERKRYSWASKPQIRKYDYIYNGKLSLTVSGQKGFRDCKSYVLENRLGDIMIQMYEAAESLKKDREAREEAERKRQEETRLRETRMERYNLEVERTKALINEANDYDVACQIRAYVSRVEQRSDASQGDAGWISWAKQKADWYDPTVKCSDEFFGVRKHSEDSDRKKLEKSFSSWRW